MKARACPRCASPAGYTCCDVDRETRACLGKCDEDRHTWATVEAECLALLAKHAEGAHDERRQLMCGLCP